MTDFLTTYGPWLIVPGVLLYLLIGCLVAGLACRLQGVNPLDRRDVDFVVWFAITWPVALTVALVVGFLLLVRSVCLLIICWAAGV